MSICTSRQQSFVSVSEKVYFGETLKILRRSNINRIIFAHININSLRNKFDQLVDGIEGSVDILMISETKLDETFPIRQFCISGFGLPYRLDRNGHGGGILVYIREDIASKVIPMQDSTIESICIEINLRKKKWFLCFSYNPNKGLISSHLNTIGKTLDVMSSNYENIVLIGDFNVDMSNDYMKDFCELYHFKNLIKGPTCFKNFDNPSSIDLILTNKYRSFCNSCTVETGLSDFHRMVVTVLKTSFQKLGPKIIKYRDYKNFSNEYFKDNVMNEIGDLNHTLASMPFDQGIDIFKRNLDLCAPIKQKYVRANNKPFVNKIITKAIMTRTRLRNKFLKNKTAENRIAYNKQRNHCLALVRKTKLDFFY